MGLGGYLAARSDAEHIAMKATIALPASVGITLLALAILGM